MTDTPTTETPESVARPESKCISIKDMIHRVRQIQNQAEQAAIRHGQNPAGSQVALNQICKYAGSLEGELTKIQNLIEAVNGVEAAIEQAPQTQGLPSVRAISAQVHQEWLDSGDRSYSPFNKPFDQLTPAQQYHVSRQTARVFALGGVAHDDDVPAAVPTPAELGVFQQAPAVDGAELAAVNNPFGISASIPAGDGIPNPDPAPAEDTPANAALVDAAITDFAERTMEAAGTPPEFEHTDPGIPDPIVVPPPNPASTSD